MGLDRRGCIKVQFTRLRQGYAEAGKVQGTIFNLVTNMSKKVDRKQENEAAVACGCKRTAGDGVMPGWLPGSALLLQFEEKLLNMFNGKAGFFGGEDDGDDSIGRVVLFDYDVSFVADVNLCPVAWGDGVCGVHAFTILVCVRGGKAVSYEVKGRAKHEFFARVLPQKQVVKVS